MNLIGKIFTVLIFVMSILFMGFAVAVYATHKNWREVVVNDQPGPGKELGLQRQLQDEKNRNEELKDQETRLKDEVAKERKAAEQVRGKLESELARLDTEYKRLEQERLRLVEAERDAVATMNQNEKTLATLRTEIGGDDGKGGLRGEIDKTRQERDASFKEVVRLMDELHQAVNELKRLRAQQVTLAADLARAGEVLKQFGLEPVPEKYSSTPPDVKGVVMAVQGDGLVEIDIGADDGLLKKHRLHVYRMGTNPAYVGDIEVLEVYPDKAVCKTIPTTLQSPVQRGDRVASRLQ